MKQLTTKSCKVERFLPVLFLSAIAFLTFLAYIRSLHAPLFFDDLIYIKPSKLKGIVNHFSLHARSVAELSFALDYSLWGMNLVAFRITNIIFHIFSGVLVSYLTYVTLTLPAMRDKYKKFTEGKTPLHIALLVATLFLLHPIQTSPVNYVTQRMAIMAGMFSFAGFILYIKGVAKIGKTSVLFYVLASLSFVLAIFSKENAVMALLMLPVYDLFFLSSFQWREFRKRFIPLFVLLIPLAAIVGYKMGVVGFMEKIIALILNPNQSMETYGWSGMDVNWTPVEFLLTELRIVSRYIFLILVPVPSFMVFDYSNAYPVSRDLFHPLTTLFSLLFLGSLLVFSLRNMKNTPLVSFGILWYLITISLESFMALGIDPYFEHRNYLPSFGLFLALSSLLVCAVESRIRVPKKVIVSLVALLLFILTFTRNGVWREGRLLWEEAVRKSPNNIRARLNLGVAYADSGLTDKAIEQYRIALTQKPEEQGAHLNLGEAFFKKGWTDKAIEEFQTALRLPSRSSSERQKYDIHYNLGLAFYARGLIDKAIEQYQIALRLRPDFAEAHVNLGIAYGVLGSIDKAMEHFQAAVQLDPELASARYNLGTALSTKGMTEAAIEQYRLALKAKPAYPEAHVNLGVAYMATGSIDSAVEHFQMAIKLRPAYAEAHINLGIAYTSWGWIDKAIERFEVAQRLNPESPEVHRYLGTNFLRKNWTEKAIREYEVSLKLEPNNAVTHYALGIAYTKKGLLDKAREQFEIALRLQPNDPRFRKALLEIHLKKILNKAQRESSPKMKGD